MLTLNEKFSRDIQRNHATVYPLIIISPDSVNPIYISTIKESILHDVYLQNTPVSFKDYALKISNIKEAINVDSHIFKISNVTLSLNNYEVNGERLSNVLSDKINSYAYVYYKTQSCNALSECLLTYRGLIRRSDHDDSSIKIINYKNE